MKIANKYHLGQKVYLVTDAEQYARMVIGICISIGNVITYTLACSSEQPTEHYEAEVSEEKNIIGDMAYPNEESEK